MMKNKMKPKGGLKEPNNPGLKKLPKNVRNRMGFMKAGGKVNTKGMKAGGMMKTKGYKAGGMMKTKGYKAGGMMKSKGYKAGGKVRGAGMCKRGVRPVKMVTMKGS